MPPPSKLLSFGSPVVAGRRAAAKLLFRLLFRVLFRLAAFRPAGSEDGRTGCFTRLL